MFVKRGLGHPTRTHEETKVGNIGFKEVEVIVPKAIFGVILELISTTQLPPVNKLGTTM